MPAADIRAEDQLLLCCARTQMDADHAEFLRGLLRQEVDWVYLFLAALQHGMVPLLYRNLNATCPEEVPAETLEDLRDHFAVAAARNRSLWDELLRLLKLLEARGISAVPFKGPALAALAYGDVTLRQFGDLDILVRPGHAVQARELLLAAGYRDSLTGDQAAAYLRSRGAYNYKLLRDEGRLPVELHWAVTSRDNAFPLDLERVWQRLEPITVQGESFLHFDREDLLLVLCQHGSKHKWKRLDWICDIAELLRVSPQMDWGSVLDRACQLGCRRMLFLGLWLTEDLLGVTLPADISRRMQADPAMPLLVTQIREYLFHDAEQLAADRKWHRFRYRVRERLRDRMLYYYYDFTSRLRRTLTRTTARVRYPPSAWRKP